MNKMQIKSKTVQCDEMQRERWRWRGPGVPRFDAPWRKAAMQTWVRKEFESGSG
ncbi:MAG: hypothetical protein ACKVPZ_13505 [Burkholderiaceae bacterium]